MDITCSHPYFLSSTKYQTVAQTAEPFRKSDIRINPEQKNTLLYVRNLERQKRQNRFKSSSTDCHVKKTEKIGAFTKLAFNN